MFGNMFGNTVDAGQVQGMVITQATICTVLGVLLGDALKEQKTNPNKAEKLMKGLTVDLAEKLLKELAAKESEEENSSAIANALKGADIATTIEYATNMSTNMYQNAVNAFTAKKKDWAMHKIRKNIIDTLLLLGVIVNIMLVRTPFLDTPPEWKMFNYVCGLVLAYWFITRINGKAS